LLRRTGFGVLVVAATVAKAQAGLAFSNAYIHGRIDPSVQWLERWNSPAALREVRQAANWRVASAQLDTRQHPPVARYVAPRAALPAAGARRRAARPRRPGRACSTGRKTRRACGTTRRSTRPRRRGEPEHARRRNAGALCEAGGRSEGHTDTLR
jgi:hypothetical protein